MRVRETPRTLPDTRPRWVPQVRSVIIVHSASPRLPKRRRSAQRQAMWALAAAVFGLCLFQVSSWFMHPTWHDRIFRNKYSLLSAHWQDATGHERTLVMGSSRVLFGLDALAANELLHPQGFDVFNFGIAAAGPVTQNLYLERLFERGAQPDVIVLEILPAFFHAHPEQSPMERKWLIPSRLTIDECRVAAEWGLPMAVPEQRLPLLAIRVGLIASLMPAMLTGEEQIDGHSLSDAGGFAHSGLKTVTPQQVEKGVAGARRQYEPYLRSFRLGGPGVIAFERTIARCHALNIPVIVLRMPEAPSFRAFYSADADDQLSAWIDQLHHRYGVAQLDARDWVPADGFHDGHHLLPSGARTFTARFAEAYPIVRQSLRK